MAHSEGGGVEVDGGDALRGRRGRGRRQWSNNDQEWGTDDLRKRMMVVCSEAGVDVEACSGARDEVAACSGVGIEDGRWRQWCDGF
jgi:hypothetical protein